MGSGIAPGLGIGRKHGGDGISTGLSLQEVGVKVMMLDYSNNDEDGDDDVVFRDVEGGNRDREDLGKKNKSH